MRTPNSILSNYGTTIFTVMSALALEHDAVNLGQGFPDTDGPEDILKAAADATLSGPNQYPPMMGIPELRQAVAEHNKRFYGIDVDWQNEVMVTSGATEALAACLFGLIEPGDEVVLIEPLYDSYLPVCERAGATPKMVRLEPPSWTLPKQALEEAFSDRTKLVLVNTPMNPIGKVFSPDELAFIAELCIRHDTYAVCDEVYEHLVFDGRPHTPLMTLPGMEERCLRIGSAGKTFSLTGWKVGYVTGRAETLAWAAKAHQFLTFTTPPNLQHAVAHGLRKDDDYFSGFTADMEEKRDILAAGLKDVGFEVLPSEGTYFMVADASDLMGNLTDEEFCLKMTREAGVTMLPMSAFYRVPDIQNYVRFCFCKQPALLEEGIRRLTSHFA